MDADVLLEMLNERRHYGDDALYLCEILEKSRDVDLFILEKAFKRVTIEASTFQEGIDFASELYDRFAEGLGANIIKPNEAIRQLALESPLPDYDSAIEHACAKEHNLDAIITHNPANYFGSEIPIWSVSDLDRRHALRQTVRFPEILPTRDFIHGARSIPSTAEGVTWKDIAVGIGTAALLLLLNNSSSTNK
ncbi:MAG: hypothetical protein F6K42_07155 [Leptolyngbya sp. SIO1D8]|nr:hypothetical protein [Leptolyngbya sp. SIO1D8]